MKRQDGFVLFDAAMSVLIFSFMALSVIMLAGTGMHYLGEAALLDRVVQETIRRTEEAKYIYGRTGVMPDSEEKSDGIAYRLRMTDAKRLVVTAVRDGSVIYEVETILYRKTKK